MKFPDWFHCPESLGYVLLMAMFTVFPVFLGAVAIVMYGVYKTAQLFAGGC